MTSLVTDNNLSTESERRRLRQEQDVAYQASLKEDQETERKEIPENKKSLSLRINYQSLHETLSSKKLDKIEKNILNKLEKKLGIYIRE